MIEVSDLNQTEIDGVLTDVNYGHLACSLDDVPYVIPIHFVYLRRILYLYTTEGKKSDIIDRNGKVCLQVEDVKSNQEWRSVIVNGTAARINDTAEREEVVHAFAKMNPTFTPAVSIHWIDEWVRENREVVYRIGIDSVTGRGASASGRNYPVVHQIRL